MVSEEGCELFGDFGVIIQGVLGVISIGTLLCIFVTVDLVVKKVIEKDSRTWKIFTLVIKKKELISLGCGKVRSLCPTGSLFEFGSGSSTCLTSQIRR